MEKQQEETTFYRFLSEIKSFLGKLLHDPINAQPSKYLKDRNFNKTKIINVLIKRGILERDEKILTPDKTGEKNVKYNVKYKVKKKDFERKMRRIHTEYFEKNLPEKINECDAGGCMAGGDCGSAGDIAGATSCSSSGQYVQPLSGNVLRRNLIQKDKKEDHADPTKILGKEIKENKNNKKNMGKKIYLTEAQLLYIITEEAVAAGATSTSSVGAETTRGDMGYDTPAFGKSKNTRKNKSEKGTDSDFFKPAMERKPGFSCERLDEEQDESLKTAALGAAMGAASLFGGQSMANAAPTMDKADHKIEYAMPSNLKFSEQELIKMFPQAYADKDKSPEVWSRNRVKYNGIIPVKTKDGKQVNDSTGMKAARNSENPWMAICNKYLKKDTPLIAFNK